MYLFRVAKKVNKTNQQLKFLNRTNSGYLVDSDDDTYYDVSGGDNSRSRQQITIQNVGEAPRISSTLPGDFQIGDHVMVYDQLANTWLEGHVMNRMNDMYNVRVGLDSKIYLREELFNPSKMFAAGKKRAPNTNRVQGDTSLNDSSDVLDSIEMLMDGLKSVTNELVSAGKRLPGATRQGGGDGFPDIPYRRKRNPGYDSEDMSSLPDNSGVSFSQSNRERTERLFIEMSEMAAAIQETSGIIREKHASEDNPEIRDSPDLPESAAAMFNQAYNQAPMVSNSKRKYRNPDSEQSSPALTPESSISEDVSPPTFPGVYPMRTLAAIQAQDDVSDYTSTTTAAASGIPDTSTVIGHKASEDIELPRYDNGLNGGPLGRTIPVPGDKFWV